MNDSTPDLPKVVQNYLDNRGLVAVDRRNYEYLVHLTSDRDWITGRALSPSLRYALRHTFRYSLRPGNLRIEMNPMSHIRRRRFTAHLDEHRCHKTGGFGRCDEAMRLFRAMPEKDQVLIG
jgi:hypothetical protein